MLFLHKFNLMAVKHYIPNGITLLNLFCGCIAVLFAVDSNFAVAAFFVFLGVFFDFFDGFFARKLNVQSALGLQLDSLADMVTSGVVPGIVMFKLLELVTYSATDSVVDDWNSLYHFNSSFSSFIPFIGLFIPLASAYRLAKFNLDEEQKTYFKGLPTPANTLLIVSLPLIIEFQNSNAINGIILNLWFLIPLTLFSCFLLNAPVKLFALKFKDWNFRDNAVRYIFLILSIVMLVTLHFAAIPLIIVFYVLLSVISEQMAKK